MVLSKGWKKWSVTAVLLMVALAVDVASGQPPRATRKSQDASADERDRRTAVFAGGCFWSVEKDFEKAPGVIDVVAGYTGGVLKNPTYKTYAGGRHREAVLVTYNPKKVTFAGLVEFLIKHIDPLDRRGSFIDRGVQYSPAIYFANDDEKAAAQRVIRAINALKVYRAPIGIAVLPRTEFWPAEEYHQDFHAKNELIYNNYRSRCGRDPFVQQVWGPRVHELNLPGAYPEGAEPPNFAPLTASP